MQQHFFNLHGNFFRKNKIFHAGFNVLVLSCVPHPVRSSGGSATFMSSSAGVSAGEPASQQPEAQRRVQIIILQSLPTALTESRHGAVCYGLCFTKTGVCFYFSEEKSKKKH